MEKYKYAFKDYAGKVHFFSELEDVLDAAMKYLEFKVPKGYELQFVVSHEKKKGKDCIIICNVIDNFFCGYELYSLLYLYRVIIKK